MYFPTARGTALIQNPKGFQRASLTGARRTATFSSLPSAELLALKPRFAIKLIPALGATESCQSSVSLGQEKYSYMCSMFPQNPKWLTKHCFHLWRRECKIQKFAFFFGEDVLAKPWLLNSIKCTQVVVFWVCLGLSPTLWSTVVLPRPLAY